jgi:hypothetical protein
MFAASPIFADSLVGSTTVPFSPGGVVTNIDVSSVTPVPSQTTPILGTGYEVTLTGGDPNSGVVTGSKSGYYAVPIINSSGDPWVGNYFSTGTLGSTITIHFATPQTGLALLWGSVDAYNTITLDDGASFTGADVGTAAGIPANGYQGFGGSAYVAINAAPGNTFQNVTFTSSEYSFEFAGVQGSTQDYQVPDGGVTLMLLGGALVGLETLRRRFRA